MQNGIVSIRKEKPFWAVDNLMLQIHFPFSLLLMDTSVMIYMYGFFVCLAFVSCKAGLYSCCLKVDRTLVLLFQSLWVKIGQSEMHNLFVNGRKYLIELLICQEPFKRCQNPFLYLAVNMDEHTHPLEPAVWDQFFLVSDCSQSTGKARLWHLTSSLEQELLRDTQHVLLSQALNAALMLGPCMLSVVGAVSSTEIDSLIPYHLPLTLLRVILK